jgi:hypothetical protein
MSPILDRYELVTPASLREALDDLAAHPGARPFAGGTDLMVLLEAGHLPPGRFVSLAKCAELRGIERAPDGGLTVGALTTYTEIRDAAIGTEFGMLKLAAPRPAASPRRIWARRRQHRQSPAATAAQPLAHDASLDLVLRRHPPCRCRLPPRLQMDLRPGNSSRA